MKSSAIVLTFLAVLSSAALAQNEIDPEWVFRWQWSPTESDQGDVIGFDAAGYTYVAGHTDTTTSYDDWVLVKVSPTGDSVWSRIYDSPSDGIDTPEYMAVDDLGFIYVCGGVGRSSLPGKTDISVVKFDSDGNQLWVYQFNGTASFDDYLEGFGMDGSGNVYIVGVTELLEGTPGREDYLLIKLLPTGDTAWVRTMPTGNGTNDRLYDIVFDRDNNILVTGGLSTSGNLDIATIKYDQNGDSLWMRTYASPSGLADQPFGIGVDDSACVYVGGKTGSNFLGIKYTPDGNLVWDFDHSLGASNNVRDVIAGPDGRMYQIAEVTGTDIGVICIDSTGSLAWEFLYDGGQNDIVFNSKNLLKLDGDGYLYCGGAMYVGTGTTYTLTFKIDRDGNTVWYNRYSYVEPPNPDDFSQIRAVSVDPDGNCFVTGYSDGPNGNWDLFLLKFTAQPSYELTPFDLISPANGDTVQTQTPNFSWASSLDPDSGYAVQYLLYLSPSANFPSPIVSDTLSDTTWAGVPALPYDSTFYWKVVAFNGHAPDLECNQVFSFFVQDTSGVGCVYIRGNVNGVPPANGIDVTYGVAYFKGGPTPPNTCPMCPQPHPFYAALDVNGSCTTNGIDITYFVAFLKGGPPLMNCPTCPPAQ